MWRSKQTPSHALGSGFVIDPAGYIVTNNHVIDDAADIKIVFTDGTTLPAKMIGRDQKTDLALLKVDAAKQLPYVAFGNSDNERIGDWVVAVGNPYGLGGSVSAGVVSGKDRDINSGAYDDFFQVDAPINPGNSGGPLFDQSGHVIGIDTAIYSPSGGSIGIGFAIPSNEAHQVIDQLREHGHVTRGWLGVQMQPVTPGLAKAIGMTKASGALVDVVTPNSPAERAGLKQGDVIISFRGQPIATPRELAVAVANSPAGRSIPVTVRHNGQDKELDVTIGSEPTQGAELAGASPATGRLGLELAPLSAYGSTSPGGAIVASVASGSPADRSGIQAGDVILAVGTHKVTSLDDTANSIRAAESNVNHGVLLLVRRGESTAYVPIEMGNG
jgi:serine protease Do